jgi:hypothetical protein
MNPVAEQIDERILRLLGLEDVFDLDYDTYMTLLREAMVKGANKLPQEELALLANERKRIRGLEGRFKPEPKKITVDSISGIGNIISKKIALPGAEILALSQKIAQLQQSAEAPPQEQVIQQPIPQDQFVDLNKTLSSILDTVNKLYDLEVRKSSEAALLAEKKSRRSREESAESSANVAQKASQAFQNIVAPFQNILDKIFGFVKFIFLGKIFLQLVEWLKDPSNVEKIQSLGRFLKDFWPLLLALYIRPLRGFIFKLTSSLLQFSGRLASKALGPIFSKAGGVLSRFAGRVGLQGAARVLPGVQTAYGLGLAGVRAFQGDFKGAALAAGSAIPGPVGYGFFGVDVARSVAGYASGGLVDGEKGIDKVPAMLTEGEVVINRKTVDAIGAEVFLALNRLYGGPGANKPKIMRFNTGGLVGKEQPKIMRFNTGGPGANKPKIMRFNTGGLVGKEQPLVNQKAIHIYNRLISRGLTSTAAMGIVSNLGVETGYTYDPSTVQGNNGPGRGLAQWEQGGRYDTDNINLVSFAKSRGKPWNDLNTQIDFIVHELNTHPEFKEVKNILNTSKTVNEATQVFLTGYEKAGVGHLDKRYAVGNQLTQIIRKPKEKKEEPQVSKSKPQKSPLDPRNWFGGGEEEEEKSKPERWVTDPRGWFGMKGGGIVDSENSIKIDVPPNASDTQVRALQLGEAVLPKGTVDLLGENLIKQIIAKTDSDSNPAKELIRSNVNRYTPTPLSRSGMGGMKTLPPQVLSSGDQMMSEASGSLVPPFSAQASSGQSTRRTKSDIYGIA